METLNKYLIQRVAEIKKELTDKKLYVVAQATGLSYPTLKKLADGKIENYTIKTLDKITNYLNN